MKRQMLGGGNRTPAWRGVVDEFRDWLPLGPGETPVTLHEGNTPLVAARDFASIAGGARLRVWFKVEGANPTGSFKDRGMAVAMTRARAAGAALAVCASTGNTAASAAAYAARAGLGSVVVLPARAVASGKLAQAMAAGARVVPVRGGFEAALDLVRAVSGRPGVVLVNSVNPLRLEGQKTAALEICRQLAGEEPPATEVPGGERWQSPDFLALPVGNGGNITAYGLGFTQARARGRISRGPRLLGFQAAGAAPLVTGRPVARPRTVATAIRIGRPATWDGAREAALGSGGGFWGVTDAEIMAAYRYLAAGEGLFCEPASAAAVAGAARLAREGYFPPGAAVVCVLTGHGLKDPAAVGAVADAVPDPIEPSPDALEEVIGRVVGDRGSPGDHRQPGTGL